MFSIFYFEQSSNDYGISDMRNENVIFIMNTKYVSVRERREWQFVDTKDAQQWP